MKTEEKMTYEQAIVRLEAIVEQMEKGNAPLEESLKLFEEGTHLSALCYSMLKNAEQKVRKLKEEEV